MSASPQYDPMANYGGMQPPSYPPQQPPQPPSSVSGGPIFPRQVMGLRAIERQANQPNKTTIDNTNTVVADALSNPYKFFAYASANYAASLGNQVIKLDSTLYDTNDNFDTSTYTYTAQIDGFYHFDGLVSLQPASAATNYCYLKWVSGANTYTVYGDDISTSAAGTFNLGVSVDLPLTKGDTIQLVALTASSETVTGFATNTYQTRLSGHLFSRN